MTFLNLLPLPSAVTLLAGCDVCEGACEGSCMGGCGGCSKGNQEEEPG